MRKEGLGRKVHLTGRNRQEDAGRSRRQQAGRRHEKRRIRKKRCI
jgi:hypothetical protein